MVKYTNHDFCIDLFETFAESEQSKKKVFKFAMPQKNAHKLTQTFHNTSDDFPAPPRGHCCYKVLPNVKRGSGQGSAGWVWYSHHCSLQRIVFSFLCTFYSLHSLLQRWMYSEQGSIYCVKCKVSTVPCTIYIVQWPLFTKFPWNVRQWVGRAQYFIDLQQECTTFYLSWHKNTNLFKQIGPKAPLPRKGVYAIGEGRERSQHSLLFLEMLKS